MLLELFLVLRCLRNQGAVVINHLQLHGHYVNHTKLIAFAAEIKVIMGSFT